MARNNQNIDEKQEKDARGKRGYFFQRNYYYDTHELVGGKLVKKANAPTREEWKKQVTEQWKANLDDKTDYWAMIFHDSDVDKKGNPREIHAHGLVKYKQARPRELVRKELGLTSDENCDYVRSYSASLKYMLHITKDALEARKYIYDQSKLMAFFAEDINFCTIHDIINGSKQRDDVDMDAFKEAIEQEIARLHIEIRRNGMTINQAEDKLYEMVELDDKGLEDVEQVTIVEKAYQSARNGFLKDEVQYIEKRAKIMKDTLRQLKTIYIQGLGGTGKTTLARAIAKKYADDRGIHAVAMNGKNLTFDMASKYNGEKVTVMDEITGNYFPFRTFLSIFDPHNYSPVNSRNDDKDWLAEVCLMTNSESIDEFRFKSIAYSPGGSEHTEYYNRRHDFILRPNDIKHADLNSNEIEHRMKKDAKTEDVCFQLTRRFKYSLEIVTLDRKNAVAGVRVFRFNEDARGYQYLGTVKMPKEFYLDADELGRVADEVCDLLDSEPLFNGFVMKDDALTQKKEWILDFKTLADHEKSLLAQEVV